MKQRPFHEPIPMHDARFYTDILDGMVTFIAFLEPDGKVLFVNQSPLQVAAMTLEDTVGKYFADCYWWSYSSEAPETIRKDIALCGSGQSLIHEIEVLTADGSLIWIDYSMHPVRDDEGQVRYVIAEGRDVTSRKWAQQQLDQTRDRMQRMQRMETMGLMAGGVAHDLNNVLSSIIGYPQLMLLQGNLDQNQRRYLNQMQEAARRAAVIVEDMLTVARGVNSCKEPLQVNPLIEAFLDSAEAEQFKQTFPELRIHFQPAAQLPPVLGSRVHLLKVLLNLSLNALDSMQGQANPRLEIRTGQRYLDTPLPCGEETIPIGNWLVISVQDHGEGIDPRITARIFEPFFTTKELGRSGSGLGLTIVWTTVHEHDGYIRLLTGETGTTFELFFPPSPVEPLQEVFTLEELPESIPARILIVDDDIYARNLSAEFLRHLNYEVTCCTSGEEAILHLKQESTDLVLLDMIMPPGINGLATWREIIRLHPDQRSIIVSGYSHSADVTAAQELGAGPYLKKPFQLQTLARLVFDQFQDSPPSRSN